MTDEWPVLLFCPRCARGGDNGAEVRVGMMPLSGGSEKDFPFLFCSYHTEQRLWGTRADRLYTYEYQPREGAV